ncbi:MAG TPA: ADOP family duplicated permease [Vicinamibacterales bacterium]|nr:ADOP family duplicated permease [Vicinamibacterales bacterium]
MLAALRGGMLVDLRHLSRNLRRSPASVVAAILTLSLTLGAGASIFAVVDAVLLTPPPFADPDTLVVLGETPVDDPAARPRRVRYATFEAWQERAGSLAVLAAYEGTNLTLTGLGAAERLSVMDVTPGFLNLLGVSPAMGRAFTPDDVGRPIVLISHDFWRTKLASTQDVIGREIVLGDQPHVIAGVLPEQFVFELNPSDVWRPLLVTPDQARDGLPVSVVARRDSNVAPASLGAVLDDVSRVSVPPARAAAIPIATAISGAATRTVGLLVAAVALAMLIAFANLAGLLIVRSIDRRRELAVRSALGARHSELVKQLVLEALALVVIGIAGGVLLAMWVTPLVATLVLEQFGGVAQREVVVNWQVVTFVAVAALVCAWLCALLPARSASRRSIVDVLRRGATPAPAELRSRRVLVAVEVAIAFVLLVCVTLVGQGLFRLLAVDPGFDARGVLALQVSLPTASYPDERAASFYSALQIGLDGRLEPRSIAIVNEVPLTGDRGRSLVGLRQGDVGRDAVLREAGPGYFDVMRIPLVSGRSFELGDNGSVPPRALISRSLADRMFASEQPIGRRIWLAAREQMVEVVGVVGDVSHRALDEAPLPTVYLSALQSPSRSSIIVVRSERPQGDVIAAVREEVARLDGSLPVYRVRSLQDVVAASPGVPARRVLTATFTGFALLALVLGTIGLFGIFAHDIALRRAELAIRIALGAGSTRIVRSILQQCVVMVGSGLAVGGVLSIWASRLVSELGFASDRFDGLSVGVAATVLIIASAAAVLPAARRAVRTDPLIALRSE